MILISLIFVFISLSCVYADENITDCGNFTQLNDEIAVSEGSFDLDKNYTQEPSEDSINLSDSMSIDGKGHSINSNSNNTMFIIKNNTNLFFKNITFNYNGSVFAFENGTGNYSVNITFFDCYFIHNQSNVTPITLYPYGSDWGNGTSCEVTSEIRQLAFEIIGKSTGLEAARKLAIWVARNINYELEGGFYQSPTETLHRRLGNCCCQTDLVIQMMDAVGLTKDHDIYYIQVGSNRFGYRHFFGMIDNICFDTGKNRPWRHGGFGAKSVVVITKYPTLPIPYGYYK